MSADINRDKADAIAACGFPEAQIIGHAGKHHDALNRARRKCWATVYDAGHSYEAVGRAFNRHHTAIMAGVKRHRREVPYLPSIKPLAWDRRSEGLSVCHFVGAVYTITSFTGIYTLVCAGTVLYSGDSEEEAKQVAHDHAQRQIAEFLA